MIDLECRPPSKVSMLEPPPPWWPTSVRTVSSSPPSVRRRSSWPESGGRRVSPTSVYRRGPRRAPAPRSSLVSSCAPPSWSSAGSRRPGRWASWGAGSCPRSGASWRLRGSRACSGASYPPGAGKFRVTSSSFWDMKHRGK